ncbi:MAG: hypothetical protein KC516_00435 [Nanoarchaeota archaeon]|nr:hypothetical protein [Nanoarchaeota archaeon]
MEKDFFIDEASKSSLDLVVSSIYGNLENNNFEKVSFHCQEESNSFLDEVCLTFKEKYGFEIKYSFENSLAYFSKKDSLD